MTLRQLADNEQLSSGNQTTYDFLSNQVLIIYW